MIPRLLSPTRALSVLLLICILAGPVVPQTSRRRIKLHPQVLERNVRAELGFLASDAMQGRGSGSGFERIAAVYIGSQFREFGLEPAGDKDETGKTGFVQRAPLQAQKFSEPPTLSVATSTEVQKWRYGHDFLVASLRSANISGALQTIDAEGTPNKGSMVLVRLAENADAQKRQEMIRKARGAQANGIVLLESDANRKTRESGEAKLPNLPNRTGADTTTESPFAVFYVSKEVFDKLAALPTGTKVDFSGPTQKTETGSTWNAVGVLRGSDPRRAAQAIMISAHLDHLGVNESAGADTIFNGADDDASGCVAVLELARALAAGKRPRRTIYFVCFGSEERGGYGARYFVSNSPVPLDQIVADLTFEMLGRPDAKVPPNTLWLTGYDRSTLGPTLAQHGAKLVADPHPEQYFFQRSDNYTLALRGVVAHTVSSFGLHSDYHQPSDDLTRIDFSFMTRSIDSMVDPIRWLANSSYRPSWLPGRAPTRN